MSEDEIRKEYEAKLEAERKKYLALQTFLLQVTELTRNLIDKHFPELQEKIVINIMDVD